METKIDLKEVVLTQHEYERIKKALDDIEKIRDAKLIIKDIHYYGHGRERIFYNYYDENDIEEIKKDFIRLEKYEQKIKTLEAKSKSWWHYSVYGFIIGVSISYIIIKIVGS